MNVQEIDRLCARCIGIVTVLVIVVWLLLCAATAFSVERPPALDPADYDYITPSQLPPGCDILTAAEVGVETLVTRTIYVGIDCAYWPDIEAELMADPNRVQLSISHGTLDQPVVTVDGGVVTLAAEWTWVPAYAATYYVQVGAIIVPYQTTDCRTLVYHATAEPPTPVIYVYHVSPIIDVSALWDINIPMITRQQDYQRMKKLSDPLNSETLAAVGTFNVLYPPENVEVQ
jgi:hypothetical protein